MMIRYLGGVGYGPLQAASQHVVAGLLRQHGDGLLQAHVEAQPLAHVVAHLPVRGQAPAHLRARQLHSVEITVEPLPDIEFPVSITSC
jgi:hypothetical protein